MRGVNRAGRWVLALAVLATAPLATWGGGCSSSLTSVQPDASGHAGTSGAGGAAGTSGEAGTSGATDGGSCPACCQGNEPSYCSADGKYMSCFAQSNVYITPACAERCPPGPIGGYAYVWGLGAAGFSGSCATGAGGQSGSNGGIGGQSGAGGRGGQSGSSGGLCAGGAGGGSGGSAGGAPAACCPEPCSQSNAGPHCSADGHQYLSCYLVPAFSFPPGCGGAGGGTYVYVWQAQSCGNGCVNPAGGASGGGAGGAPGCQ